MLISGGGICWQPRACDSGRRSIRACRTCDRFRERRVFDFRDLETRAEDAMANRVDQHVLGIGVGLAQNQRLSRQAANPTMNAASHISVYKLPIVFQEEPPTSLKPVGRKAARSRAGQLGCCATVVDDLALRDQPRFPAGAVSREGRCRCHRSRCRALRRGGRSGRASNA